MTKKKARRSELYDSEPMLQAGVDPGTYPYSLLPTPEGPGVAGEQHLFCVQLALKWPAWPVHVAMQTVFSNQAKLA